MSEIDRSLAVIEQAIEHDGQPDSLDEIDEGDNINISLEVKNEIFFVEKLTEVFS
jgi:hypothetical protein